MLDLLIASGTGKITRRQRLPGGLIAIAAHGVTIAGAVWATLEPVHVARTEPSPVILTWPDNTPRSSRGALRDAIPGPPETVVDAPPVEPIGLPPIAPGERTEPFLPVRVVVGLGMDSASAAGPLDWRAVEEPPALLAGRPPAYPELLRAAGIEGRVVLEVVIDTLGRAEGAARVVESSNRGFEAAARAYVQGALFRPGRVGGGRAVRVLIRLPIGFSLQGAP
jgi:TonB family protein